MDSKEVRHPMPIALPKLGDSEIAAVSRVLRSGWITQGPEVAAFESEFGQTCHAPEAVAVSNCTTALQLVMYALGIGSGDEVITVSHSFIATANAIVNCGAYPIFVDIDREDFNMSPAAIEAAITRRTKAIIAVHQLGMPCRLAEIAAIAKRHNLALIEDAACAIGSELLVGNRWQRIGAPMGIVSCFSFHPRKLLTTGDGGMITTFDRDLADRLRRLRQHGMSVNDRQRHMSKTVIVEQYDEIGFNYRLTDLQAAIGREQLKRLPSLIAERRGLVELYHQALQHIPDLIVAKDRNDTRTNWQSFYVVLPEGIDQLTVMQYLLEADISTRRGVMCAHLEPAYSGDVFDNSKRQPLTNSEYARNHSILLPLFPNMKEVDILRVSRTLEAAIDHTKQTRLSGRRHN